MLAEVIEVGAAAGVRWGLVLPVVALVFAATTTADGAEPGQHVVAGGARYTLEKPLGAPGYSSQTFRARDAEGRVVAVKLARPDGQNVAWSESTYAPESALLTRLKGTPAIGSHGVGHLEEDPARLAHVMELARGHELGALGADGRVRSAQTTAKILDKILIAVDGADGVGVRHYDIKPQNLAIEGDDESTLRVLDWGASTRIEDGTRRGNATFHPPEQWMDHQWEKFRHTLPEPYRSRRGSTAGDHTGDLFNVGAVGLFMATGGKDMTTRAETIAAARASLGGGDLASRQLLAALERAVALDPAERHQSASEFRAALRPVLDPALGARLSASLADGAAGAAGGTAHGAPFPFVGGTYARRYQPPANDWGDRLVVADAAGSNPHAVKYGFLMAYERPDARAGGRPLFHALGPPLDDEHPNGHGGYEQHFASGMMRWTPAAGGGGQLDVHVGP